MSLIEVQGRVGPDGILQLRVPMGLESANKAVRIVVETTAPPPTATDWQQFIDRIAGSIPDETFQRQPQGDFEEREELFP